jgi:Sec-independent protein translocase protein TatA
MNIGLGQLLLVIFVCFLLFGNISNAFHNLNTFFQKFKDSLNNNK